VNGSVEPATETESIWWRLTIVGTDCSNAPERRTRGCRPTALVREEVDLALPIRLASTDDSVSDERAKSWENRQTEGRPTLRLWLKL